MGGPACASCHRQENEAWLTSHHARAMQPANRETIAGRFDGASLRGDAGATFLSKGDDYLVRTGDSGGGAAKDFKVEYTFGVFPLQQYLVAFPGGRFQALRTAWDSRPREQGGQRWFELYPGEHIDSRSPLHWTRLNQNWNFVCADCHSTNLRRNYDAGRDEFHTTYSDVSVACEACHGPGSRHIAWANASPANRQSDGSKGLTIDLDERAGVRWIPNEATGNPVRSAPRSTRREIDTCGVCHARRSVLGTETGATGTLMDRYEPALLTEPLYFPDGQQKDEVYDYGSFLQSRMYAAGVTCSDCHDPHTGAPRAQGNALCERCHSAAVYDTTAHHMHTPASPGAQCTSCHMPARTYMAVNPRPDHSLRVPRPDLTVKLGVPNPCTTCHSDKSPAWAAAAIERAHPGGNKGFQHFAEALAAARSGAPGAAQGLSDLALDESSPVIARATAVSALQSYPAPARIPAIEAALRHTDPLMRYAALEALLDYPTQVRGPLAAPLADDPVRAVRVESGRVLAGVGDKDLDTAQRGARDRAFDEYVRSQKEVAERPESHYDLAIVYAQRGSVDEAVAEFRHAISLQPDFVPAYVNLADLYRALNRESDVSATLAEGLKEVPGDGGLLHAQGLALTRAGRTDEALGKFEQACAAQPRNARYAYVYGVALHSAGQKEKAMKVLRRSLETSPYDPETLGALASFARDDGQRGDAQVYAKRLLELDPDSVAARQLWESVSSQ